MRTIFKIKLNMQIEFLTIGRAIGFATTKARFFVWMCLPTFTYNWRMMKIEIPSDIPIQLFHLWYDKKKTKQKKIWLDFVHSKNQKRTTITLSVGNEF